MLKYTLIIEGSKEEIEEASGSHDYILGFERSDRTDWRPHPLARAYWVGLSSVSYKVKEPSYRIKTLEELVAEFPGELEIQSWLDGPVIVHKSNELVGCQCSLLGQAIHRAKDGSEFDRIFVKEEM
jgi:hypothetical protein